MWERFRVTPLGPEELLDAVVAATQLDAIVEETGRLDLAQVRYRVKQRYGFLFDVDEETDQNDYEGTIAQALALLNGSVVATGASVLPGSTLSEILAMPGDDAPKIEALYLCTLSRLPAAAEIDDWSRFVQASAAAPPETSPAALPLRRVDRPAKGQKLQQPDPLRGLENRAANQPLHPQARAYEDVLWALLNSSEFVFNH